MGTEQAWPRAGTGLRGMVGDRAVELGGAHRWEALDCDVTDASAVHRAVARTPADVVVHFAAYTDLDAAHVQTGDRGGPCYRVNVEGTRNLARACRENGKYLIHVSTDYVFSGDEKEPYRESDRPDPRDWYGRTKYWAEGEVRESGCRFSILRLSFPFRARYRRREDLVRKIIRGLVTGRTPPMFCDTLVSPTFTDEFVAAIDRVAELRPPDGLFQCAGGTSLSPYDLTLLVARVFDLDSSRVSALRFADYARTAGRPYPRHLNIANAHAERVLGIRFSRVEDVLVTMRDQMRRAGVAGPTALLPAD
ncbi:SDR family oxidoreductase [Actinoplanes flavus]|uniref:dTDP-4-dehydrorhamnose reductase n=1 Tax=Actinoplanes flavus TaxID=2820290 RepID=A0ABS3US13_9ACTN|nr:SDR family oxidoreductase [Actinoplanes flavus]MBO3741348.1 SDR family oxidoreductase [Actinoplanes flavus]